MSEVRQLRSVGHVDLRRCSILTQSRVTLRFRWSYQSIVLTNLIQLLGLGRDLALLDGSSDGFIILEPVLMHRNHFNLMLMCVKMVNVARKILVKPCLRMNRYPIRDSFVQF